MRFAKAYTTQENDIGVLFHESESEQILYLQPVDFLWPVPVEIVKGFEHRKSCLFDAVLSATVMSFGAHKITQYLCSQKYPTEFLAF